VVQTQFGGLDVVLTGGTDRQGGGRGPLVVLLHGFGAPGDDLVSLHRVLAVPPGTRFAFPAAPVELGAFGYGDARAWWMIDMMKLQSAMARGDVRDLTKDVPEGLSSARLLVDAMLDELTEKLGPSHVVLGGFSQGAMLSADVTLRSTRPLAGLVLLSGTMIAEAEWKPLMAKRAGLPVFQSHGQSDAMLPFSIAERLSKELGTAGLKTRFVPFRGGHEIPPPVLDGMNAFFGDVLGA
jgi:phospholipase/carboxylesterase